MSNSSRQPPSLDRLSQVWQTRTDMVKQEAAAASAAIDAKTARLKALRLAKEAEEAEGSATAKDAAPKRAKRGG